MNNEEKRNSLEPEDIPSTGIGSEQEMAALQSAPRQCTILPSQIAIEKPEAVEATEQQIAAGWIVLATSRTCSCEVAKWFHPIAGKPVFVRKQQSFFEEQPLPVIEMAPRIMRYRTRRDVLAFGIGAVAIAASAGYLLPQNTLGRLGVRRDMNSRGKEWLLNKALRSTMTWLKHSTREIVWCPPTQNLKLPRSRTTTTEPLLTLGIYRAGI